MAIRWAEAYCPVSARGISVYVARGVSGIDGITSTALGVSAGSGSPLLLVTGDVAFIHDVGGLFAARHAARPIVILLLNNDGGGIFSLLPQATVADGFEELFGTPHGLDFSHAAELYDLTYRRPTDCSELRRVFSRAMRSTGVTLIEIRTDRKANADLHAELMIEDWPWDDDDMPDDVCLHCHGDGMTDIVRSIGDESEVYRNQGAIPDLLIAAATPTVRSAARSEPALGSE